MYYESCLNVFCRPNRRIDYKTILYHQGTAVLAGLCTVPTRNLLPISYNSVVAKDTLVVRTAEAVSKSCRQGCERLWSKLMNHPNRPFGDK